MSATPEVKLQALLATHAGASDVDRVKRWLEERGVRVTGSGERSLSAQLDADTFRNVFGELPPSAGGFVDEIAKARALPVPEPLRDVVELLTLVPRHQQF